MGLFSKSEPKPLKSPIFDMFDAEPVIILDAIGANIFVYDKFIVLDRTKGGLLNLGNRTYKIIPIKSITAIQVKSTGVTTGFIEFSTPGHEYTAQKGFERANDENTINFSSEQAVATVAEIVRYLLPKII